MILASARTVKVIRHQHRNQYFDEDLGGGVTLRMMRIPSGRFLMGSPEDELERQGGEGPQHEVTISEFVMGKYPITQAQWRRVAAMPWVGPKLRSDPSTFKGDDHPVENVSWEDAVEFCDRLSQHTGRTYRLPSEAEWEYACRANTTTPFHFGDVITTGLVNYRETDDERFGESSSYGEGLKRKFREKTSPVGSFAVANEFGLCDMHGNVWEWCQDIWHKNYDEAPTDGSAWLEEGDQQFRIRRGGSWSNGPMLCRAAFRIRGNPAYRNAYYSFRVVCVAPKT